MYDAYCGHSEKKSSSAEIFAEWLRRQGYRVIRTASSFWYEASSRVYQAIPYHWLITPTEEELDQFLKKEQAIALRYSTPITASKGQASYHVVLNERTYDLNILPKKARYDVRKGLSYANIEPISFPRLAEEGWASRIETLARQGRSGAESQQWWERLCLSAEGLPGFETWGALHKGKLVASLVAFTMDGCTSILYQQSLTDQLKYGVNNVLTYAFTTEVLSKVGVSRIFYGLHSLDAPASVDEFKFRMGYMAKPVRQRVVFNPWLKPFFNRASYALIRRLRNLRPGNPTLAKTEGMFRFYLEGQRPLDRQTWPEILVHSKPEEHDA
jgi:hypothetical protein